MARLQNRNALTASFSVKIKVIALYALMHLSARHCPAEINSRLILNNAFQCRQNQRQKSVKQIVTSNRKSEMRKYFCNLD